MAQPSSDVLGVLRFELGFLERGGYGRSARTPWKPALIFLDSLTCPNFSLRSEGGPWQASRHSRPCSECALYRFVPPRARTEPEPCYHIPLNEAGQTLASLDRGYNRHEMEEAVIEWLRRTIAQLESEAGERSWKATA